MGTPRPRPIARSNQREVEALRRAAEVRERELPDHLDGDGARVAVTMSPSSTKALRHGLGRKLRGWYLIDGPKASAGLDGGVDETARSNDTLTLRNSSTRTLTFAVWVY